MEPPELGYHWIGINDVVTCLALLRVIRLSYTLAVKYSTHV